MQNWIHLYPQVERLLQQDPDEELAYDANTGEVRTPYPSCPGPPVVALSDEEYRREVRAAMRELHEEMAQQREALEAQGLANLEDFRQSLSLSAASGEDLDRLGEGLGMTRYGEDDATFRTTIRAAVAPVARVRAEDEA